MEDSLRRTAPLFVARLPYYGSVNLHGTGLVAGLLQDSYGFLCIALLVYLAWPLNTFRRRPETAPISA